MLLCNRTLIKYLFKFEFDDKHERRLTNCVQSTTL